MELQPLAPLTAPEASMQTLPVAALPDAPGPDAWRALRVRVAAVPSGFVAGAARPFHPAFGNGDTPHYGL
jgi:fermentation-respiration switch protein FrsA (DUF1100 family)